MEFSYPTTTIDRLSEGAQKITHEKDLILLTQNLRNLENLLFPEKR